MAEIGHKFTFLVIEHGKRERRLQVFQLNLLSVTPSLPEFQGRLCDMLSASIAVSSKHTSTQCFCNINLCQSLLTYTDTKALEVFMSFVQVFSCYNLETGGACPT